MCRRRDDWLKATFNRMLFEGEKLQFTIKFGRKLNQKKMQKYWEDIKIKRRK